MLVNRQLKGAGSQKRPHDLRFLRFYASYIQRVRNIKETYFVFGFLNIMPFLDFK